MEDRELERMLRSMPLRRPERLPGELSELLTRRPPLSLGDEAWPAARGRTVGSRFSESPLGRLLAFRVTLWQAAAVSYTHLTLPTIYSV